MGGLESIGGFIRKYGGKEAKDIIKKGGKDWNKNGKVEKEESADIDGNKKVTDEELAKFYIDNRSKFAKTSLNEYIFKSIDTIWGSTGADGDKTAKAEGTIPKITKADVIDQEKADGYLSVLLNKSATFEQRLEAAKSLIEIFSVKAGFSKESASKFASLFSGKTDGKIAEIGVEEILKKEVYGLLINSKIMSPSLAPAFYAAVSWRWGIQIPIDKFNPNDVKNVAEALYEKFKSGSGEDKAEVNKCVMRMRMPIKMWFYMKAIGDKGIKGAEEDHKFIIASKAEALKLVKIILGEKDDSLVSKDIRIGAFELLTSLTGKIYIDELLNLLNFYGMETFVFQKLMPIVKKEIAYSEAQFNEKKDIEIGKWPFKEKAGDFAYKQSAGWWKLLSVGQYKEWVSLNEYDKTYALQSSNDEEREGMYMQMAQLGRVSVLDKLFDFMIKRDKTPDYKAGRRAEEVFKNILIELNKYGNTVLFDSSKLYQMADLVSLAPGKTYKLLKPIKGTFGFDVEGKLVRQSYDYEKDFVVGYYHFLYMTLLSGGKTWESGIIIKPRFSGHEKSVCNPPKKAAPDYLYPSISVAPDE